MSTENDIRLEAEKLIGLTLALFSGILIGISFIITKKGLQHASKVDGFKV